MLSAERVRELIKPFGPSLSGGQVEQLLKYLNLLLRWNKTMNLTSITKPEEVVQRHFGESFCLTKAFDPAGKLLDIGSGAGFPGLALKILYPELSATLLEPVTKKRAFLKEAARECGMSGVQVLAARIETFAAGLQPGEYEVATARAVGQVETLIPSAAKCLKPQGKLALWLGEDQVGQARHLEPSFEWLELLPIPHSDRRVILIGRKS